MGRNQNPPEELLDPMEGVRIQKVNTEFYLGRLAYEAAQAGLNKEVEPLRYKNAVEQLEIMGLGSDLLTKKDKKKNNYWDKKKLLETKYGDAIGSASVGYNSKLRSSKLNQVIEKKISFAELEFITALHKLLMEALSPLFYTKYITEVI